jgi:NADH:ubiquinone oxidoreductase subunit 6 (subunit J)
MADPIFIAVAVLTVGTAIMSLEARELIYGAISLAISMLGIAGFFLLLDAPFVAMFQIAVYVGAVAVLLIYTPAQLAVKPKYEGDVEIIIDERGATHG